MAGEEEAAEDAEDIVVVVVTDPAPGGGGSAGRRYKQAASGRVVRDTLMITKPGSLVEAVDRQTAADSGGQESRSGTEGCGVLRESDEAGKSVFCYRLV